MEPVAAHVNALRGARVFLTGHTGFKGAWMVAMLRELGASVAGFSLPPPTSPSLFDEANLGSLLERDVRGDICDLAELTRAMQEAAPDLVLHMAAQPLVLTSVDDPVGTFSTNVQGTVNVLQAVRSAPAVRAAVVITSDKCYDPSPSALTERAPLGGHDPYSASKAAAEIVVEAYRRTYFANSGTVVASVRAGNVIGGGDWSQYRIVPDLARAFLHDRKIVLRHPDAVRPWQHVADALHGYLLVAQRALRGDAGVARGWNFGPLRSEHVPVREVVDRFCDAYGAALQCEVTGEALPENPALVLDSSDARQLLEWEPRLSFDRAIAESAAFYRERAGGKPVSELLRDQVRRFLGAETSAA